MKTNAKIFALIFMLITSCATLDQQSNVSFQVFYDQLGPYGQWVDYDSYGYVWIPYAREDFAPYSTNGHWVYTQYGWAWMSDYSWGWAPFHYGRWGFTDVLGWFWVPGYEWGPAWVYWLQGDGYYGWSPIGPGMSINFIFDGRYDAYRDHWCFVRDRDLGRTNIYRYYANPSDHERIMRSSTAVDRTYNDNKRRSTYVSGPDRDAVQRASGRTITPYSIRENNRPAQEINNRQMRIYRPQIDRNSNPRKPAPDGVIRKDELRRTPIRDIPNRNQNVTPIERPNTQPDRRQDVTPPQRRVEPSQNRNVTPRRDNPPERQPRSTDTPKRDKQEGSTSTETKSE